MSERKRIFIASPLRGDYERNMALARFLCQRVTRDGYAAWAPHIFYTQFLDDRRTDDRAAGIDAGCAWLTAAHEVWVYAENYDVCSVGMQAEVKIARIAQIPVRFMPPQFRAAKAAWAEVPK